MKELDIILSGLNKVNLNQKEISDASGVPTSTLSEIRNRKSKPSLENYIKLKKFLLLQGINIDE